MAFAALRKLYDTEFMVPKEKRLGEIPPTKKAYRTALGVALPSMSESFLVALVSMVDTMMVSFLGTEAIAAVALCTQPRFIIMTLVIALNVAVTSVVARRKGENDAESASRTLRQSVLLSFVLSSITTLIALAFVEPIMWAVGAQHDTIGMAADYFGVLLLGVPGSCVSMTICAAQRGIGATKVAMRVNITANLVNIVFNYLLIGGNFGFPRLEVKGAAIATVIGWMVGLVMALVSVFHKQNNFLSLRSREGWLPEKKILKSLYGVASGAFIEQIFMRIGFLVYNVMVAGLGTTLLAANTIGMNIMSLSFSIGDGLGVGASTLVGQNLGRKRPDLSTLYVKVCQRIAAVLCVLIFIVFVVFGRGIFSLFISDPVKDAAVLAMAEPIMVIGSIIVMGQAMQLVYMGSLRGAGDTRYTAVVSMLSIMILRPGLAWLLIYPLEIGLMGAWISFLADQYLRFLLTYLRFRGGKWMNIKL